MKRKLTVGLITALFTVLAVFVGLAYATTPLDGTPGSINALGTGYAITRWPYTNGNVLVGQSVTVMACTTQPPYPDRDQVTFVWIRPDGTIARTHGPVDLTLSGYTWNGLPIYTATDSQVMDQASTNSADWGVQAQFTSSTNSEINTKIKAISWDPTPVPEFPFGTIAAMGAAFGAMGLYINRKRLLTK